MFFRVKIKDSSEDGTGYMVNYIDEGKYEVGFLWNPLTNTCNAIQYCIDNLLQSGNIEKILFLLSGICPDLMMHFG